MKTSSVGLPLFCTESPDRPISDGDEGASERLGEDLAEIRELVSELETIYSALRPHTAVC